MILILLIGSGIFTTTSFYRGDYLLTYRGDLVDVEEGDRRYESRKNYETPANFLYFFEFFGFSLFSWLEVMVPPHSRGRVYLGRYGRRERATAHRSSAQRKSSIYTYKLFSVLKHTKHESNTTFSRL